MNSIIHLFYLRSYSHLIVADGIIKQKGLPLDSVYFVLFRGVKLPPCYEKNLLYDESGIVNWRKFFMQNYFKLNRLFKDKKVCGYLPFQGEFPVIKFFDEYVFFEEGISAYDVSFDYTRFNKKLYLKLLVQYALIRPFVKKNLIGLYNGRLNGSPFSFECTLVGLTKESYKNVTIEKCKREIINITAKPLNPSGIKDSVIIVMDSTRASDRMDSADGYLRILSNVLKKIKFESRKVYLKLHPDNFRDMEVALDMIRNYIGFVDFSVIDESLEDIAQSNQNNIFIGNHSTILFYAPILGSSNKSISFMRIQAEQDKGYLKFLQRWGGVEGYMSLFKDKIEFL